MAETDDHRKIGSRCELISALKTASQLEHGLCCLYLFAAFSLRKTEADFDDTGGDTDSRRVVMQRVQRWQSTVLEVARQEMEHLGIVINMLNALGEEPFFWRPGFPLPPTATPLGEPFLLERFGSSTLERFMAFERPGYFSRDLELVGSGLGPHSKRAAAPSGASPRTPSADGLVFDTVQELYDEINAAFQNLDAADLFRGPTARQVNLSDLALGFNVRMMPVTDRASAAAAIGLVLEQGEGIGDEPLSPDSHFLRFTRIKSEFDATRKSFPDIDPAFPVAMNPLVTAPLHSGIEHHVVQDPFTRSMMELFNEGYYLMVIMLKRFFATFQGYHGLFQAVGAVETRQTFAKKRQGSALLENAFFPFMTMFIRPLGEMLVHLPVGDGSGLNAGCSYELPAATNERGTIPDFTELEEYDAVLARLAAKSAELYPDAPEKIRGRLEFLHQNLYRMRENFRRVWTQGD